MRTSPVTDLGLVAMETGEPDAVPACLERFLDNPSFRSAAVEELVVDRNFFRRPLRPEDLNLIDFARPLDEAMATSLAALTSHRMLLCTYEQRLAPPPEPAADPGAAMAFYGDEEAAFAARRLLESFAFGWLEGSRPTGLGEAEGRPLAAARAEREARYESVAQIVRDQPQLRPFLLLQKLGLLPSLAAAIRLGMSRILGDVAGALSYLGSHMPAPSGSARRALLEAHGLSPALHAHWQFYLPTTLAGVNRLHCLAARPQRWFEFAGAAAFAVIDGLAFQHSALWPDPATKVWTGSVDAGLAEARSLHAQLEQVAPDAARDWRWGFEQARLLQDQNDEDVWRQLVWLADLDSLRARARAIEDAIRQGDFAVDREVFVEPREMCSTTHVHDDHRLVVVESGDMVFWGYPGMTLPMPRGQAIVIPKGRLHGSTVTSSVCVYNQPILSNAHLTGINAPPPWVAGSSRFTAREHHAGE